MVERNGIRALKVSRRSLKKTKCVKFKGIGAFATYLTLVREEVQHGL